MVALDARQIAAMLADRALAVCRTYLPNGVREGNYWMVGDATGTPGRSTHVRLTGPLSGKGAAGRWADEATGEYGNLLDIIRLSCGLLTFPEVLAEAARFLSLPKMAAFESAGRRRRVDTPEAGRAFAQRLFTASRAFEGSLAETYLRSRSIEPQADFGALRFAPRCFHTTDAAGRPVFWPALIARVTDLGDELTGISRTYLSHGGDRKAPVDPPRRARGDLFGHGIRFGKVQDVLAAGEGLETTLSLRAVLPTIPLVAASSANHLAGLIFPPSLRRLIIICDNDQAGHAAVGALGVRGASAGLEVVVLMPERDDLNGDLMHLGKARMLERVGRQLGPALFDRFA